MATVTKVSAQKRPGRYNIFLEGKYAFSVAEKTLTNFVLLPGKELTSQQIEKIKQYDADAQASNLAARYLNYEPRSIYELLTYLKKHQITSEAAKAAVQELTDLGYRVELDDRNEKIGYKIREAQMNKIPYMLVIGDKEIENNEVGVRSRKDGDIGAMSLNDFENKLKDEVETFAR